MQKLIIPAAAVLVLALLPAPAHAQNLIPNATFDSNLSNWQVFGGAQWDPADAEGELGSGSAQITNTSTEPDVSTIGLTVCVPADEGIMYQAGFDGLIPAGQGTTGRATMTIVWFDDVDCEIGASLFSTDVTLSNTGEWERVTADRMSPVGTQSALVRLGSFRDGAVGSHDVKFDNVFLEGISATCVPTETTLCLADGRFAVEVTWATAEGDSGLGFADQLTPDTGTFWFFDEANIELVVKVLNACAVNDRFWVFAGGLTNVAVEMTVTDTESGEFEIYENPQLTAFQPIQDANAFDTCP